MKTALKDSLNALDDVFQDFIDAHLGDSAINDELKRHIEAAHRHIEAAKALRVRMAIMAAAQSLVPADELAAITISFTQQEKWLVRTLANRKQMSESLLGSESSRLLDLNLIQFDGGQARLTEKGIALNASWKKGK